MLDIVVAGGLQKIVDSKELFDAQFEVSARSEGFSIQITWSTPDPMTVLNWSGRVRVLRKQNEWPRAWNDPDATLISDVVHPPATTSENDITQTDLVSGNIYYYTLFQERTDGWWIEDVLTNRESAYPYDRWGCAEYMFNSVPKGWRIDDAISGNNDLFNFMRIVGALSDNLKTDAENLLTLMSAEDIHADLLDAVDAKIFWPSWKQIGEIARRKETLAAVDTYKLLGSDAGYETLIQMTSLWNAEICQGWKYVMFSNGLYGSTTPDTTVTGMIQDIGTTDDIIKYTNGPGDGKWHCVNGLLFKVTDVPGVSAGLTPEIISRWHELIEFGKATYVDYLMLIDPTIAEEVALLPTDFWDLSLDLFSFPELVVYPLEEDLGYTAPSLDLFTSNVVGEITNSMTYRTMHVALAY